MEFSDEDMKILSDLDGVRRRPLTDEERTFMCESIQALVQDVDNIMGNLEYPIPTVSSAIGVLQMKLNHLIDNYNQSEGTRDPSMDFAELASCAIHAFVSMSVQGKRITEYLKEHNDQQKKDHERRN